jgi:hypothetical protein
MKITQKKLQDIFYYIDGILIKKRSGKKVGVKPDPHGYGVVKIDGQVYKAHRIIFKFVHGYLPDMLDHRDGNRMNNNITNLRPATAQENSRNAQLRVNSTSGVTGISFSQGKWRAYIYVDQKQIYLGRFLAKDLAIEARRKAQKEYFGDFSYGE